LLEIFFLADTVHRNHPPIIQKIESGGYSWKRESII
jgi:hypothetical protein